MRRPRARWRAARRCWPPAWGASWQPRSWLWSSCPRPTRRRRRTPPAGRRRRLGGRSAGEQLVGVEAGRGMAQLRHGPGLDLADPLGREVDVGADLVERTGLAPVQAEAQTQDLLLPARELGQHLLDLATHEGGGGLVERGRGAGIGD